MQQIFTDLKIDVKNKNYSRMRAKIMGIAEIAKSINGLEQILLKGKDLAFLTKVMKSIKLHEDKLNLLEQQILITP